MSYWQFTNNGLQLRCYIQAKASRDAIVGVHDQRLKIAITAPPTDGKANKHLLAFLAKTTGISQRRIHLLRGLSSRQKTLFFDGLTELPKPLALPNQR